MASDDVRARLAEIRAREEAATPAPWRVENNQQDLNRWVSSDDQTLDINFGYLGNRTQNDAAFVAHAREDVPWLLAEIERLIAALHRHGACALCGHERHRHGYEPIIRQDWCSDCPTASDLHTFETKEQP